MRTLDDRLVCAALLVAMAAPASAERSARSQNTAVLEEITVTAQKRAESLHDVPASIGVVSGDKLADAHIVKIEGLDAYVPSLTMAETAIGSNISIRGIFSGVNPGFEQSVGTYVDGIYRGRPQQTRMPFLDLERVEVLRGPQSILFGKNSVAGALNITTAQPTAELERVISAAYDPEHQESSYTATLSGSLDERVRGRLTGGYRETDGYIDNLTLSRHEPGRDEWGIRGALEWQASDTLRFTLKAEQGQFDVRGRQAEVFHEIAATSPPAAPAFDGLTYGEILVGLGQDPSVLNNRQDYKRSSNGDHSNNDTEEYALTTRWMLGDGELTAITGYSAYSFEELCDCDFTGADIFQTALREDFRQFSQEIRFASSADGTFQYLGGLYFESSDVDYHDAFLIDSTSVLVTLVDANPMLPPGSGTQGLASTSAPREFRQESSAYTAFFQGTWNLRPSLRLTGGLRYTHEEKDATRMLEITTLDGGSLPDPALTDALYAAVFNLRAHTLTGSRNEDRLLPSVVLQWRPGAALMTYASWTEGAKSGGFDARSNNPPANGGSFEFADEDAASYEIGAKVRLGGRGELNAAVFHTDFRNLQVSVFDGVLGFNVGNAARAVVQGVELDSRWAATPHLTLTAALAYTDFEFKEYFGQCYFGLPPDAPDGVNCSYAGKTNEFVADWNAVAGGDYRRLLGTRLAWALAIDANYSSGYNRAPTLDPHQQQAAYVQWNARFSLSDRDDRWSVALVGHNLTDKAVMPFGGDVPLAARTFGAPSYAAMVNEPSSVAVEVRASF